MLFFIKSSGCINLQRSFFSLDLCDLRQILISMIYIIMGVSGSGKTTIGKALAKATRLPFYDADDFHPTANIEKMSNGQPLNDNDRQPWLTRLAAELYNWEQTEGAILACSALKENYRQILRSKVKNITWIYLSGSFDLIYNRIQQRKGHYMKKEMLQSQFDALEVPDYGLKINISKSVGKIIHDILESKSDFGVIGLGVMGSNLSLNIADKGFKLSVYNRSEGNEKEVVSQFLSKNSNYKNIQGFTHLATFVESLQTPRRLLLMVKAGEVIDLVLKQLTPLLYPNDIVIDGGNSHYLDTKRRAEQLAKVNINFIGTGISGGEKGARFGASIMPGGTPESYQKVADILESIAAKDKNGQPCCAFIGKDGAGHFIKMIHNGIEYAEMQLLAECYALLKSNYSYDEIYAIFKSWDETDLSSFLLEITANIFQKKEGHQYLLDLILDKAGNKGTGSWSSQAAMQVGFPATMINDAVYARYISSFKEQRQFLENQLIINKKTYSKIGILSLKKAYQFARIINHIQGFALIQQAADEYDWNLNFSEISRIWTNGCIIRSALMEQLVDYFKTTSNLMEHPIIWKQLNESATSTQEILTLGLQNQIATPVFSSAYQYWLGMTTGTLSANLIQAQRDYFGAHTYQRTDKDWSKSFHTKWD